jgi:hypothetical protein
MIKKRRTKISGKEKVKKNAPKKVSKKKKPSVIFAWRSPEFIYFVKGSWWYIGLAAIVVIFAGIFVWIGNYAAVAIMVLAGLALYMNSTIRPKPVNYQILEDGIKINGRLIGYDRFKSFWISTWLTKSTLYLQQKGWLKAPLSIHLIDPEETKNTKKALAKYLPERKNPPADWGEKIHILMRF